MSAKLWGSGLHPLVEAFTVGEDFLLDKQLLPYDLEASKAHAIMLESINVISKEELDTLKEGLDRILSLWKENKFDILPSQEDCHTAIEQFLTENYGEVGKKIHTGRSRNDQSLVMIRLFMKASLKEILTNLEALIETWDAKQSSLSEVLMPGYTHMQRAMPTTVGRWLNTFECALKDSLFTIRATLSLIDQNPLGSAAGFGIANLQLDRAVTTKELGFASIQGNPMYCGFSRGYFENIVLQALSQPMIIFSRFAADMMMFTQQETNYFALPDEYVTGSSIMPQKKNYDLFEIMRGNGKVFASCQMQIQEIIQGLGCGYHRDLQLTKKPFLQGVALVKDTIDLLLAVVPEIIVKEDSLRLAMSPHLYATEDVYKLVAQGITFREAYKQVKEKFFSVQQ
eukprot:TRINITY_DN4615_c0_g1_i1.p1 TRINITY_DN4615_c0_g1~~TRINITY_DN4615_c0_g1_i1.p1  ORF type:complete len:398 (-),score=92.55 TRINITY_DN4615_c0_g1_i1:45-1238(-)